MAHSYSKLENSVIEYMAHSQYFKIGIEDICRMEVLKISQNNTAHQVAHYAIHYAIRSSSSQVFFSFFSRVCRVACI